MKSPMKTILCAALVSLVMGCQNTTQQSDKAGPETEAEKVSYAIGADIGRSIANIGGEIELSMLQKGLADKIQGKDMLVSDEEAQSLLQAFSEKLRSKDQEEKAKAAQKNLEEGQAFLEKNKTEAGVVTTESGLQYKVVKEGEGPSPKESDQVSVNYRGTKLDGTEFDSSYKRGEPATFKADQVIKGWTEALQLMKEGGEYQLFIPAELAYGPVGAGGLIGPNEVLIFDVELLKVLDDATPQPDEEQETQEAQ